MEKKQILFIGGGESFETDEQFYTYLSSLSVDLSGSHKNWRDWIAWALTDTHQMIVPSMPAKGNAKYEAWKIWFEKHLPFLTSEPVVIGHSLGTTFLLKWLTEHSAPVRIKQLHLVAPYIGEDPAFTYEKLGTFAFAVERLPEITNTVPEIHLWHSKDDDMVPYSNTETIHRYIPSAHVHAFSDRGHFLQPAFPELLAELQK